MRVYDRAGITIHRGDARAVAATLPADSFSLAILDGPYALGKATWDCLKVSALPEWYAPHLDDVDRICAPSASLYVWNTAEGWATLHPGIVARGWAFGRLLTWDKGMKAVTAYHSRPSGWNVWPDATEVCGMYRREAWAPNTCAGQEIAYAAGADERNWIRPWLRAEWGDAGLRSKQANEAMGTNGMAGHYFGSSQWALPTWDAYQRLAAYAAEHGTPRPRPYLVHPSCWTDNGGDHLRASYDHLRASCDHLRAEYDHLRAEYEASRPHFDCPLRVSNVWTAPLVSGAERLADAKGNTLHPCQKPLAFADRIIRASSRPGEAVWVPFGGTCREAVAALRMAQRNPEQARRVVTAELDEDGRDYLGAVVAQLGGDDTRTRNEKQADLFGAPTRQIFTV